MAKIIDVTVERSIPASPAAVAAVMFDPTQDPSQSSLAKDLANLERAVTS